MQVHLNGGILENQRRRFHQHRFAGAEFAHEHIARGVQQEQAGRLRGSEAVHEHAQGIMRFLVVADCVVNQMLVANQS